MKEDLRVADNHNKEMESEILLLKKQLEEAKLMLSKHEGYKVML